MGQDKMNFHTTATTYQLMLALRAARIEATDPQDFYERAAPIADEVERHMKQLHNNVAEKLAADARNLATGLEIFGPFDTERLRDIANALDRIARS